MLENYAKNKDGVIYQVDKKGWPIAGSQKWKEGL